MKTNTEKFYAKYNFLGLSFVFGEFTQKKILAMYLLGLKIVNYLQIKILNGLYHNSILFF